MSTREEQAQLLMIKGALADEPPEKQEKVKVAREAISAIVTANGDEGRIALAMVALEIAIREGA